MGSLKIWEKLYVYFRNFELARSENISNKHENPEVS